MPDWTIPTDLLQSISKTHWIVVVGIAVIALVLIVLPSGVAAVRQLPDRRKIYALNVAGLVAFSCWFAALGWALLGRKDVSFYDMLKGRGTWVVGLLVFALLGTSMLALMFG